MFINKFDNQDSFQAKSEGVQYACYGRKAGASSGGETYFAFGVEQACT